LKAGKKKPTPTADSGDRKHVIKTLIDSFRYPRLGPGQMWEACAEKIQRQGGYVHLGRKVIGADYDAESKSWTVTSVDAEGNQHKIHAANVISTAPVRELATKLLPNVSPVATKAAGQLKYRDFLTVALILEDKNQFDDNWIYIHDPKVKVGRVQNFKSWSPELVPDAKMNCYGLEYFCFEGDGTWAAKDEDLIELAKKELAHIGLAQPSDIVDGCVVRQPKAYPVYDDDYATHVETVRKELEEKFPTLHMIGRNGMHKYNNQDHAMMTAMLCVKNIVAGERAYDLWQVNGDAEYHESGNAGDQKLEGGALRMVPQQIREEKQEVTAAS
ncbi:MAG: FAD-dependent oxidoreductase, partial [Gemmataceae bacterium]